MPPSTNGHLPPRGTADWPPRPPPLAAPAPIPLPPSPATTLNHRQLCRNKSPPPRSRASSRLLPPPSFFHGSLASSCRAAPRSHRLSAPLRPHVPPRSLLCLLLALLSFLLLSAAPAAVAETSALSVRAHHRILVLLDLVDDKNKYSNFWNSLEERGYNLTFKKAGDKEVSLEKYGVPAYDNLILFAPKSKDWGPNVDPRAVVNFVKNGGNIVVSLDTDFHESWRALAFEFGLDFDDRDTLMIDHFAHDTSLTNGNVSHTRLAATNVPLDAGPVLDPNGQRKPPVLPAPVLYEGIGHRIVSDDNRLVVNVLTGGRFSYSRQPNVLPDSDPLVGTAAALVSVVQARNNARAMFMGSLKLASDEFWSAPVQQKGKARHEKSGNANFLKEITKWVFQEKGVLRVISAKHNKVGMQEQPTHYRIKDNMTYTIQLEEYHSAKWHPFSPVDAQLEVRMLDPYIRRTLRRAPSAPTALTETITLPDVYGVFTLRVNYQRPGLSFVEHSVTVPVHPFRHNEYPRFLSQAFPYYASAFSMAFGFLAVSAVWMFHRDLAVAPQPKKSK